MKKKKEYKKWPKRPDAWYFGTRLSLCGAGGVRGGDGQVPSEIRRRDGSGTAVRVMPPGRAELSGSRVSSHVCPPNM